MKVKYLFLLSIAIVSSISANAQYMNSSSVINLPSNSFNTALASGMYEGAIGQNQHPNTIHPLYLIVAKRTAGASVQQLQISSSISILNGEKDKLYFRKIYDNTLEPWIELATRGKNTFTGNQVVLGTLSAKEIRVEANLTAQEVRVEPNLWADFVFEEDYELPSLEDVNSHIQEKKHLPGIPSAQEVKENGVGLAEMNVKLLQKIEELTLYIIDLEKRVSGLEKE